MTGGLSTQPSIVVDASVAAKWMTCEPDSEQAESLLALDARLIVPDILYAEVAKTLWKRVRRAEMSPQEAGAVLEWLTRQPLDVYASPPLLLDSLDLACTHDRAVYDAIYVALTIREGAVLVTADGKLAGAMANTPFSSFIQMLPAYLAQ